MKTSYQAVKTFGGVSLLNTGTPFFVLLFPLLLAVILNFIAVIWAVIRSIATKDVLTPRVLMAKLRRSARVEG